MTITTGMHPSLATADVVYRFDEGNDLECKCFLAITRREWEEPDASVGDPGGWIVRCKLIGAQIGGLVLGEADARAALDRNVAYVEREAAEMVALGMAYETPRSMALAEQGEEA